MTNQWIGLKAWAVNIGVYVQARIYATVESVTTGINYSNPLPLNLFSYFPCWVLQQKWHMTQLNLRFHFKLLQNVNKSRDRQTNIACYRIKLDKGKKSFNSKLKITYHILPVLASCGLTIGSILENIDHIVPGSVPNAWNPCLIQFITLGNLPNYQGVFLRLSDQPWSVLIVALTHWGRDKWPPFSRRHFLMHFLEWKCINFDLDFTEVCFQGSN